LHDLGLKTELTKPRDLFDDEEDQEHPTPQRDKT